MRNLKRVLALALALVMMLGMMITASAATYADQAAIDEDYVDAVEILTGMGVFEGTGAGFAPKQILDRASAAALVYRVITGDVNNKQTDLYDYSSFADVAEGVWYTPYITYAADNGYLKGYAGNAMPNDTVTGIQVLAMMLRAAGYGQNGEFEGAAWKDGILTAANDLGITKGISTNDLDKGANRELVAQLIWNVISEVKMVAYSPILNTYIPVTVDGVKENKISFATTQTLGEKVFDLAHEDDYDNWGRPVTHWFADNYKKGTTGEYDYKYETLYATIEAIPEVSYTVATSECDIAADLGLRADAVVSKLTVNGDDETGVVGNYFGEKDSTDADEIDLTAMNKVGAQGRLVEFYYNAVTKTYEVVMLDQFLVKVTDVTEVEYDKNGHIKWDAALELLFCGTDKKIVLESDENWAYTKGEMLLIYWDEDKAYGEEYAEILGTPDTLVGAQTAFTNKESHIVEGTEYPDAINFWMDEAFKEITDHTWYFDTYGNLIGVEDIDAIYSYGVISAIKWYENDSNLEDGYAIANITYMDGTTEKATIASIDYVNATTKNVNFALDGRDKVELSEDSSENTDWVRTALYEIETTKKGLKLTATQYLDDATTETGRPALNASMDAGKNTMFLVWNNISKKYETYTGIANVPSYKSGEFWAKDKVMGLTGDGVAEYVFIDSPVAVDSEKEALYFIPGRLIITANMHPIFDTVKSYTISGGYVDGVPADLTVLPGDETDITDNDIYKALVANTGKLVGLNLKNGNVIGVVHPEALGQINFTKTYAVYAGAVADMTLSSQDVLKVGTQSYDVEGAELISTVGNTLSGIFSADKAGRVDAYLYVVYTFDNEVPNDYTKTAKYIYATDKADTNYDAPVDAPVLTVVSYVANATELGEVASVKQADGTYTATYVLEADEGYHFEAGAGYVAVAEPVAGMTADGAIDGSDTTKLVITVTGMTADNTVTVTGAATPTEYTITYVNTGIGITTATYTVEDADITPASVSKAGWAFKGWYEAADFSGDAVTLIDTARAEDITLYAKYEKNVYTVTVNFVRPDGFQAFPSVVEEVAYGGSMTYEIPAVSGYLAKIGTEYVSGQKTVTVGSTSDVTVNVQYVDEVAVALKAATAADDNTTPITFNLTIDKTEIGTAGGTVKLTVKYGTGWGTERDFTVTATGCTVTAAGNTNLKSSSGSEDITLTIANVTGDIEIAVAAALTT